MAEQMRTSSKGYPNLIEAGADKRRWTMDNLKDGFQYFVDTYGHYPTAPEIDRFEYLPSSRSLQRSFGGLENVRKRLGLADTHLGKGAFRSELARRTGIRGREVELEIEKLLIEKFGEIFVHTEKGFGDSKRRIDFFVYSPSGNFGIDVFHTNSFRDLQKNVNLKIDKYIDFAFELYFLVIGDFEQSRLDAYALEKAKPLSAWTAIVVIDTLLEKISTKRAYPNPLHE